LAIPVWTCWTISGLIGALKTLGRGWVEPEAFPSLLMIETVGGDMVDPIVEVVSIGGFSQVDRVRNLPRWFCDVDRVYCREFNVSSRR
jgi:hypothetical protein